MDEDSTTYLGTLSTLTGLRVYGHAMFNAAGIIITGVAEPQGHSVAGLPEYTRFVPFQNVGEFLFADVPAEGHDPEDQTAWHPGDPIPEAK